MVMFLFVIGLEMRPARLWELRRQIFGMGAVQVAACGTLLTLLGVAGRLPPPVAFVGAMGFTLSSTAIVAQILDERGETNTPRGQRVVASCCWRTCRSSRCWRRWPSWPRAPSPTSASRWVSMAIGLAALAG